MLHISGLVKNIQLYAQLYYAQLGCAQLGHPQLGCAQLCHTQLGDAQLGDAQETTTSDAQHNMKFEI